jgi:hypothetical protein
LPKPRHTKVAVIGLLLLLLLPFSDSMALTLPNPPDSSAPANNQNGQLPSTTQSFTGGVSLVKDVSTYQNVSMKEFIASFFCATSSVSLARQYKTAIGESISGPISKDQSSGIIDAIDSVKPPVTVSLPLTLRGVYGGNLTYFLTGITYNVTTYSVWITTQQSPPVEQRVGYVVVSVPERQQIGRSSTDLAGAFCPSIGNVRLSAGFGSGSWSWLTGPLGWFSIPPEGGLAPIITYGTVRVLSSAGVAGAARIRPGENATFVLPPGTYSAEADVVLFGVPLSVRTGTYSSPEGAGAARFTVSLTSVYSIWYALEVLALAILIVVIGILARKLHLWRAAVHGSARLSHALRSLWEALLRQSQGDGRGKHFNRVSRRAVRIVFSGNG